jgi:hypothetical protein
MNVISEPQITIKPIDETSIQALSSENCKLIHETILKVVPRDQFLPVKDFAKPAVKKLQAMNFPSPFDCIADAIRVLDALVSVGLVASSYQVKKEICGENDRICGAIVKYKLATERDFL